jgi:lysophospholipase L1-like esterase
VLVPLAVAEVGLRLAGFSWYLMPELQVTGPQGTALIAGRYRPDPDLLWVSAAQDAPLAAARRAAPDVVFLGDSCTELSDYPQQLLDLLRVWYPQRAWSGLPLGTVGWTAYEGRVRLVRDVLPLHPRLVTLYFGWNDHWLARGLPDRELVRVLRFGGTGLGRLRVVQLAEKAVLGGAHSASTTRVPLAEFRRELTTMVRASRAAGVAPLLITAPTSHRRGKEPEYLRGRFVTHLEDLVPLHQAYVQAVREVAREEAAPLCDTAAAMAVLPAWERARAFHHDGIHLNERGARWLAATLDACIEREGIATRIAGAPGALTPPASGGGGAPAAASSPARPAAR